MTLPEETPDSLYRAPEAFVEDDGQHAVISKEAVHLLVSSRPWMRIAAIAIMVNGVITAAAGGYILWYSMALAMEFDREPLSGVFIIMAALAFLIGARIFYPGLRLLQSSLAITRAVRSNEDRDFAFALRRHQEFWRSLGTAFVIVILAVLLLFRTALR